MASIFELHNRSQFYIIGFSLRASDGSEWRKKIEKSFDEFYNVPDSMTAW